MTVEDIEAACKALPHVTQDIKWEHNLCYSIGDKMFLIVGIDNVPVTASFKVPDEEFEAFTSREGLRPAPYLARYKWVYTDNINRLSRKEWTHCIRQSYELIKSKLPRKKLRELGE